jgi:hypothetical protein
MKKVYLTFIATVTFFINIVSAQSPGWLWAKRLGGSANDICNSTAVDAAGNIYTTGYFYGTADFDPGTGVYNLTSVGSSDIFICKLDSSGNFLWAKSMGSTDPDFGNSIIIDPTGSGAVYTTGQYHLTIDFDPGGGIFNISSAGDWDIFISKLDSSGNFIWAKSMGGLNIDAGNSITSDALGNIYTTGRFTYISDFDPGAGVFNLTSSGSGDVFISKLDSAGNFIWAKATGGTGFGAGNSILTDSSGNGEFYITGIFSSTIDFDPGTSVFNLTSAGSSDIFILKLDSLGNFIWGKAMGGADVDWSYSIAIDASGNSYITGYFQLTADFDPGAGVFNLTSAGNTEIFISKLDSSGNFLWAKQIGGTNGDIGYAILFDPAAGGNIYTTGFFRGTADFDPGAGVANLISTNNLAMFILKLDSAGNYAWAIQAGPGTARSIVLNNTGDIYIAGDFTGPSATFGSIILTNDTTNFSSDVFVAKLDTVIISGSDDIDSGKDVLLFSYPSANHFILDLGSRYKKAEVTIFDSSGKIFSTAIKKDSQKIEVSTLDFAEGIYFIQIQTADFLVTKKIVVLANQ